MVPFNVASQGKRLTLVMSGIVCLNVLVIALETDLSDDGTGLLWQMLDLFFLLAYMVEVAIRLHLKRQAWIRSPWNWFDAIIILIGLITFGLSISGRKETSISLLRLLKLVRLVRLVKISHLAPEMMVLLSASTQDMITLLSLLLAAIFGLFAFSIAAVSLIGRNEALQSIRIGDRSALVYDRFGTIPQAFVSLFELVLLDGWDTMCRPIVQEQPGLIFFILAVIVVFTFGALNVIVALVIQKCNFHSDVRQITIQESRRQFTRQCLQHVNTILQNQFLDDNGHLTYPDFALVIKDFLEDSPQLRQLFKDVGFSMLDIKRLFYVLDRDRSGTVSGEELTRCIENLIMGAGASWDEVAAYSALRSTKKHMGLFIQELATARQEELLWSRHIEAMQQKQTTTLDKLTSYLCQPPSEQQQQQLQPQPLPQQDGHPAQHVVSSSPSQQVCSCCAGTPCGGKCAVQLPHQVPSKDETDESKYPMWTLDVQGVQPDVDTESEIAEINGQPALANGRGVFRMFFHALTLLNILLMAVEYSLDESSESDVGWTVIDSLFVITFAVEIAVRMYWERKAWITRGWNWFDLLVTILSALDLLVFSSIDSDSPIMQAVPALRVLRIARVVRLLKFAQHSQQLYAVLTTMVLTMKTLSDLFLVLIVSICLYGIAMVSLIGKSKDLQDVKLGTEGDDTVKDRFGNTIGAMFSLFELMTLEGWIHVYRPLVVKRFWVFLPVAAFVVCFTYAMLNMVTAFVIEKNLECKVTLDKVEEERTVRTLHKDLHKVQKLVEEQLGALGNDLSYEMFESVLLKQEPVRRAFIHVGCSARSGRDIYEIFDWDCSGNHTIQEFFEGLNKLQDNNTQTAALWHFLAVRASAEGNELLISRFNESVVAWRSDLAKRHAAMEQSLAQQEEALQAISKYCVPEPLHSPP